jgi:hypothetical protein
VSVSQRRTEQYDEVGQPPYLARAERSLLLTSPPRDENSPPKPHTIPDWVEIILGSHLEEEELAARDPAAVRFLPPPTLALCCAAALPPPGNLRLVCGGGGGRRGAVAQGLLVARGAAVPGAVTGGGVAGGYETAAGQRSGNRKWGRTVRD